MDDWISREGGEASDRKKEYLPRRPDEGLRSLAPGLQDLQESLQESEALLAGQKEAFQAAVNGAPLETSLGFLVRTAIRQARGEVRCAFYMTNAGQTKLWHVVGMPEAHARFAEGFKVSPDSLACRLGVHAGHPVITADVTREQLWKDWLWFAAAFQFRACWSFPIATKAGKVVGTFVMYHQEPREATPRDYEVAGGITNAASIIISRHQEMEDRLVAEAALWASEEQYRILFESIDEGFCIIEVLFDESGEPADYRFLHYNPAFERQTGLIDALGKTMRELVPAHEQHWFDIYGRIALTGVPARFEDGASALGRWYDVYAFRIGEAHKRQVAILFRDILERKRNEDALRSSEQRQRFLVSFHDTLRPLADPTEIQNAAARLLGEHLGADRAVYADVRGEVGSEEGTFRAQYVRDGTPLPVKFSYGTFGPEIMALARRGESVIIADAMNDPRLDEGIRAVWRDIGIAAVVAVMLVKNGRWRASLAVHSMTPRDWTPAEIEIITEVAERTWATVERAQAEEHRRLLIDELNHRVKNTLATVQSLATQTLRNAGSSSDARSILDARLVALAKAHDVLTREQWTGAALHQIIADSTAAYADRGAARFSVSGPDLRLQPKSALALSMALHELATNAVKYGALSNETGSVGISWQITPDIPPRLRMRWVEHGGPPVDEPGRRGFGSRLVEKGLAQDLGGTVRMNFERAGLVCTIDAPLAEVSGE